MAATSLSATAAKTLVFCSEGNPNGFQPALYTDGTTFDASSRTIYDRLVEFKPGTTEVVPGLATSWTVTDGGKVITFHLRKGVKFQSNREFTPTRDFNADDVIFTFERMLDKNNPYHNVSGGTYDYFDGMDMPKMIKSIKKIDAHTVEFILNVPNAPFIANMAMDFASINSAEYANKLAKEGKKQDLDLKPIGTGPFELVAYQPGSMIRYKAFKDYWRGKAAIDTLVFSITPNASVRWAKLKANECQVMDYPNPTDLPAMKADSKIKVLSQPGLNVGYLAFNTEKKPFDKLEVRKALYMAINKQAIVEAIFHGTAEVAVNPMPPTIWSYNKSIKDYPYDPAKAKKMLAQAGYPNGFSTNVWAMPVSRPYNPDARRMAEMIQADWAKIGVKAKIVTYEWGEYLKRLGQARHDTALLGWTGDNGDPDNFLNTLLGCAGVHTTQNIAEWCYQPFQKLVTEAQQTTNLAKRTRLYEQAQVIFHQQVPWVPIDYSTVYMPMSKNVIGYKIIPTGSHYFYGVSLK
ncbi:ABC transporter substrate-binding protein [Acidihalobacter ferrooxydans]|uniref:ABC transporter substrate-binding protein n=1 Tax=Acidihalobacter ferrooxydans TaxID=1765967 RepID=UPI0022B25D2C|nr:ABC transporter substrate-binding protein [Acidihalobacter ferrooxydans]